jgi:arylsulfatase A-like enzyme
LTLAACSGPSEVVLVAADAPLHLEQHLDAATITGSVVPADVPAVTTWRFDAGVPRGGVVVDVPDYNYEDLAYLLVRARTSDDIPSFTVHFNLREGRGTSTDFPMPFTRAGENVPLVSDGTVQTYRARLDYFGGRPPPDELIHQVGLWFGGQDPVSLDILSIELIPKVANYADAGTAARTEMRGGVYRQAMYMHAPGSIAYRVSIPEGARLDFAMGVLREDVPVSFRVTVDDDGPGGDEATVVLEEAYADKEAWGQRSADLAEFAGRSVTLALEATSVREGTVALWGSPTLTSATAPRLPNVIFYVFDGGAADFMSVYGYNRRTTPTLEKLAAEGVAFERAYSNASWTLPSTASFMTSLQNSVTGGLRAGTNKVPAEAVTMAEHMHRAGYHTGVFTGNPNAGTLSDLQRGVDVFREDWADFSYFGGNNHREASRFLHEGFWQWREAYPRQPFWAHFQTTDTHEDFPTVPPFAGRFVSPADRERWREWSERLNTAGGHGLYSAAYDSTGIIRTEFFSLHQGMYDEAMAHNDYQLGRLVDRLKAEGQWDNTLLIIGGDHSTRAAMDDMVVLLDSLPPRWGHPFFRPTITHVPLMFVWPARIPGGQRFDQPVSMLDVLPTLLDLVGLPPAEIAQGQSLAPLMLGQEGWEPRPVIFDEFYRNPVTDSLSGTIEVVDGRWGASLQINPDPDAPAEERRPSPLLLYDLWNDPMAITSLHEERPDLVEKYTTFLEAQFRAHLDLATFFSPAGDVELTAEQLQTLRSLGYIR